MSVTSSQSAAGELLPVHPRDFHILLTLLDGECHGYGIVKAIERRTAGQLRLDPANLYRALQRLMQSGLVRDANAPSGDDQDGRKRRYHGITQLGRTTLDGEAERMRRLADAVQAHGPVVSSEKS